MLQPRVAIVGAGPAGYALAADLHAHHNSVLIYSHPSHTSHTDAVIRKGVLRSNGLIVSAITPRTTTDMADVVAFAKTVVITVPSTGQETVWEELRRFDLSAHTIVAVPGNLFGLVVQRELRDVKVRAILETNLSPYSCRMSEGALVVLGKKSSFHIARLDDPPSLTNPIHHPPDDDADVRLRLTALFPLHLHWCANIVEVCLSNINGVFHPLMVLLNAGRIESTSGAFFFYRDGLTRSVANALVAVDTCRIAVGAALGMSLPSVIQVSNECYGHTFTDLVQLARESEPHRDLRAPQGVESRNIAEDVGDLLVAWYALARVLGVECAPLYAVIVMAGMCTGVDYLVEGRGLARLGLEGVGREELIARFGVRR
ncbi:NAD/NADP octopine/nopaline dehydrogenase [Pseudovirgaria hyperparasitica]|uniref:NAD/NADP octopine/nopaline dehydrogenase n=1 Tax=Pseudovirgaria hyperparasitica TaxID=470096 RepID=A0A6A6WAP4_9PEZI|nr:NAD/NADP octopine/nopaline dehydrogenase [Pseudovirgaria hyperparasitica]KAF2759743.1 NAD/NADP octopine/nopaline dehydrogenase [Pseudovirgaria hyperparasitica]